MICPVCNKKFTQKYRSDQKHCSDKCRSRAAYIRRYTYYQNYWLTRPNLWKWKKSRKCKQCGMSFIPKRVNQGFCSNGCLRKGWKKKHWNEIREYENARFKKKVTERLSKLPPKTCPVCQKVFFPLEDRRHPYKIYCSEKCRLRMNHFKRKALEKEILKHPEKNLILYWKVINRKRVQDANYHALHRGCKRCAGNHIHLSDWLIVKKRYNNQCAICGVKESISIPLTIDHIKAITNGGHNMVDNIQPLCRSCNSRKGNRW